MTSNAPLSPEDLLSRAEIALRRVSVDDDPSPEALERTVAALHAAESSPGVIRMARRPVFRRIAQLAAVAAAFVAAIFGISEWRQLPQAAAFAEVAQKLRDATTLRYRMRLESPDMKQPEVAKVFVKGADQVRMESASGPVTIADRSLGKSLTLDLAKKRALLADTTRAKSEGESRQHEVDDVVEHLRKLTQTVAEPAGQKEIAGRKAQGFRAKEGQLTWLIWADAETKEPLLAEASLPKDIKLTLSDFELNPPLDDQLFSLSPPDGYTVQNIKLQSPSPEEAVARLLRAYAEVADKAFPPRLDDWVEIGKRMLAAKQKSGAPQTDQLSPEALELATNAGVIAAFFTPLKQGYAYTPEGAKLGDAERIIFWYQRPQDEKYRALYADLHWSTVAAGELPKKPAK